MKDRKWIWGIVSVLLIFIFFGCDTNDDTNPSPVPDVRDKFVGIWNVVDACSKANYDVNISKDPSNSAQVLLDNFADSGADEPDTAIIAASSIVLYRQFNSEGWLIKGNGSYKIEEKIDWDFELTISGYEELCTGVYTKGKSH